MDRKSIIITTASFVVGVGEALLYYNMGQANGKSFRFKMPPTKEFMKTVGVVFLTSLITTALFKGLEMAMVEPERALADNDKKQDNGNN